MEKMHIHKGYLLPLLYKKKALEKKINQVETLVLGSSHGYYGFLAENESFNLCDASQDLYYSFKLYEKYQNLKKLKQIVLFYSVFSAGSELEKTKEKERCFYYKKFFNIPYKSLDKKVLSPFNFKFFLWKISHFPKTPIGYCGNCLNRIFFGLDADVKSRVESHMKNNQRHNHQTEFVEKMIQIALQQHQQLYIVIPPCRSDYISFLPKFEQVFQELLILLKKYPQVKLFNFFNSSDFSDADMGDMYHMNLSGAEKLTKKIMENIKNYEEFLRGDAK